MRASAIAEKAGIPSVSIVATGFLQQARAIARALGMPDLAIVEYPGVPAIDSKEEFQKKVEGVIVSNIIEGLNISMETAAKPVEPGPRDIIFKGTLEEVHDFFIENLWTDGLPVIPPTLDKVEEFLKFTNRSPDEVIGVLLPENREATVWNIAVNGVMAGCRPEYIPILIAAVEAIAESKFRIEDAGSTPGWEPIIILNGPIIKELDFNYESGMMRVGRQANTSIGRFLRLYMRNVAGLRTPPGVTDKGSIAGTFNVVLAENEGVVAELGWESFGVNRGFKDGENVVTVQSVAYISPPTYSDGDRALNHLETIAEVIGRRTVAYWTPKGVYAGKFYPFIVISPSVARVIARDGYTKDKIKQYLYENAKAPAEFLEKLDRQGTRRPASFCDAVADGAAPKEYCESTDPDRMVPVFMRPDWIGIVVSGDPGRNQSRGYVQNHGQGIPVSKRIELPANWEQLLKGVKTRPGPKF
ncbi:hypothetical protein ACFLUZ_00750 [Chloroflexota bacterium]